MWAGIHPCFINIDIRHFIAKLISIICTVLWAGRIFLSILFIDSCFYLGLILLCMLLGIYCVILVVYDLSCPAQGKGSLAHPEDPY